MCLELFSQSNWRQALVQCSRMLRLRNPSRLSCRVQQPVQHQLLNSWGRRHREKSPETDGEAMLLPLTDNIGGVTRAGRITVKLAVRWQHNITKTESHPGGLLVWFKSGRVLGCKWQQARMRLPEQAEASACSSKCCPNSPLYLHYCCVKHECGGWVKSQTLQWSS